MTSLPSASAATPLLGVIAASLPVRRRLAARTFEAQRTRLCAQALAAIFTSYEGLRAGVCNLGGGFQALRSLSFIRAQLQSFQESSCVAFVLFSPTPLHVVALSHAHKEAWRRKHGVQGISAKGA